MAVETLFSSADVPVLDLYGILLVENKMLGIINPFPIGDDAMPFERFRLHTSANRRLRILIRDENLDKVDITGATAVLTVKHQKSDAAATITKSTAIAGQGEIGAADSGELFFYIVPADTSSLGAAQYVFDVVVTVSTGEAYNVLEGRMDLESSVA
jgi:hypothetical protein